MIIAPTRELALQITEEANKFSSVKGVNTLSVYGGQDVEKQIRKLNKGVHLVIGTPGRLIDHLNRGTINFDKLDMLILDEADQMLHMGFLQEIEMIIKRTPKTRQTMLFSATMPRTVKKIANKYMKSSVNVYVESKSITLDEIEQIVVETTDRKKQDELCKKLDEYNPFLAVIFCRTKRRVSDLNKALQEKGYNSDELHGDLSQTKRERVMKTFREAKIQYLVATDVAARGIDVEGITHVFNYDTPEDPESYIHRIGRTGRAGESGVAVTFVTPKNMQQLLDIERHIKINIEKQRTVKEFKNKTSNKPAFNSKKNNEFRGKNKERKKSRNTRNDRKNNNLIKLLKGISNELIFKRNTFVFYF